MAFSRLFTGLSLLLLAVFSSAAPSGLSARATTQPILFEVTLTWEDYDAIGGPSRKVILTNGTVPGPPLKATVGDDIEFLVHNNLPNSTTIHFHGIEQKGSPWSDGVPGLSQKVIQPGTSYLYKWTATESGVYFYHAHYRSQIMDGLYGAIIIQASENADKPFALISNTSTDIAAMEAADNDLQPIFVSDWNRYTSQEFYDIQVAGNIDDACADAIVVNAMGSQYCLSRDEITAYTNPNLTPLLAAVNPPELTDKGCLPPNLPATQGNFTFDIAAIPADAYFNCTPSTGPMANITVDPSKKWAALTFISSSGFSTLKWTIDGHKMWVYAADGHYITPQLVDQVTINNGERYSVLIELNQPAAQYSIRVANNGLNQVISGFAILNYLGSVGPASSDPNALSVMNFAGVNTTAITPFVPALAAPYPALSPAADADLTYLFNIKKLGQPFGAYQWTLSGIEPFNQTEEDVYPLLFENPSSIATSDLILKTESGQWVDLVVKVEGPLAEPHPMHKHSNKAFILGQGVGTFDYSSVAEAAAALPSGTFNFETAPYRDGFTTTPAEGNSSWIALRYHVENPGAFLFHCHMQTHLAGGMAIALLDGVDQWPTVPEAYLNNSGFATLEKKARLHPKGQ